MRSKGKGGLKESEYQVGARSRNNSRGPLPVKYEVGYVAFVMGRYSYHYLIITVTASTETNPPTNLEQIRPILSLPRRLL